MRIPILSIGIILVVVLQCNTLQSKVIGKLGVTARVGVAEGDQQSRTQWQDLNKLQKLSSRLNFEKNQRIIIKISASDSLHQVFVMFRNNETNKEVTFIAQPETEKKTDYKLELDLLTSAKDFGFNGGVYEVTIQLGDFLIEDSFEWPIGEMNLQLVEGKAKAVNPLYTVAYGMKPEIQHMFRKPEARPTKFLSDVFTLLALVPLLVLFLLWLKIGANINNFSFSLSAIAFHLGLTGMFGVYSIFWSKLSMFEALKWMMAPGAVAFIGGHRLLCQISERRKAS